MMPMAVLLLMAELWLLCWLAAGFRPRQVATAAALSPRKTVGSYRQK
jgi:hypothetical protein